MTATRTENRKLPAWIGSILVHTVLLLLVLLWFSLSPGTDRRAPGVRNATGMIMAQPGGGGPQTAVEAADDRRQTADEMFELAQVADINLSILSVTPVLAPGQNQNVAPSGGASAGDLAAALQQSGGGLGSGVGPGTGEVTVSVFGTGGTGMKFMYVFDRSSSMEGAPIRHAKMELIRSLDSLGDHHQFNIIFYSAPVSTNDRGWQLWQPPERGRRLIAASAAYKQSATRFVDGITAFGGTRHYEPLIEAIRHRPDVIFFLTDGESQDDLTPAQLSDLERENSRFGRAVQINVIQFGRGGFTDSQSRSLEQLATDNHGQYRYFNVLGLQ